ncbi:hypothetical protein TSOC_005757 [Tetrabaena socialis]|uniref:SET domain-containing protein n=1 Tax=Tetrabaena socialis TaxID=47790 RepID=A0A2J8A5E1_9CHLO|nr:hypothetical protein TSOC_005757 [Tetrabaena socialis]|eukprot:PNH07741.1 hypothetical protein TSOC_005757 [Tetrabaena socialis]
MRAVGTSARPPGDRGVVGGTQVDAIMISDDSDGEGAAPASDGGDNGAAPHSPFSLLLPAPSITHMHGCVPPALGLPPLSPGELRLCGLTFAASVAPAVRRDMRKWKQPGARAMGELQAVLAQMRIPGFDDGATVGAGGGAAPAAPAGAAPWLDSAVLCWSLGQLLRAASGPGPKDQLPSGPVITRAVQPGVDLARGGAGLFAGARIPRSAAVGVLGGYVQPAGAAQGFRARGFEALSYASRAELRRRADAAGEGSEGLVWSFLAGSFSLPYGAPEAVALAGEDGPLPPLELHMLGYGNLTALVNDPRSDPWGERLRVDRPGDASVAEAAAANCMVVPVCVRGLLLPVLVALHDIAPGEQILRDYGAGCRSG